MSRSFVLKPNATRQYPVVIEYDADVKYEIFQAFTGVGEDRKMIGMGGVVVAFMPTDQPDTYLAGVSMCSPEDAFDKELGKLKALGRITAERERSTFGVVKPADVSMRQLARKVVLEFMDINGVRGHHTDYIHEHCLFPEDMPEDLKARLVEQVDGITSVFSKV